MVAIGGGTGAKLVGPMMAKKLGWGYFEKLGPLDWLYAAGLLVSSAGTWLKHRDDPDYRSLGASGFVNILGGCCGTTPEHIRLLGEGLKGRPPRPIRPTGS